MARKLLRIIVIQMTLCHASIIHHNESETKTFVLCIVRWTKTNRSFTPQFWVDKWFLLPRFKNKCYILPWGTIVYTPCPHSRRFLSRDFDLEAIISSWKKIQLFQRQIARDLSLKPFKISALGVNELRVCRFNEQTAIKMTDDRIVFSRLIVISRTARAIK